MLQLYFVDVPGRVVLFMLWNTPFYLFFLYFGSMIPILLITMATINFLIKRSYEGYKLTGCSEFIVKSNSKLIMLLMVIYEYVWYSLACNFLVYIYFSPKYRENLGIDQPNLTSYFWIGLTFIIHTLGTLIVHTKVYFLRPLTPNVDFFGKTGGVSENMLLLTVMINAALSALRDHYMFREPTIERFLYSMQVICYLMNMLVYLNELPFYNKFTEHMFGHMVTSYFVYFAIDVIYKDNRQGSLKVWVYFLPFQLLLVSWYIKNSYRGNYLKNGIGRIPIHKLKYIYLNGFRFDDPSVRYSRIGVFKEHMKQCKKLSCTCRKVWQSIISIKRDTGEQEGEDLLRGNSREKVIHNSSEIDRIILKSFVRENKKDVLAMMMYLTWIMKYHFSFQEILEGLNIMSKQEMGFRESIIYYYTLEEMKRRVNVYYYSRELTFNEEEEMKNIFDFPNRFKKRNKEVIDLYYGLRYKESIEALVNLIQKFSRLNIAYLHELSLARGSLLNLNNKTFEMRELSIEIETQYERIEDKGRIVDYYHIPPYFYFKRECLNLYKSASRLYSTYRQRLANKSHLIDRKNRGFENLGIFYNSVIIQVAAEKENFGIMRDAFGDTAILGVTKENLIGKEMNYLIPNLARHFHQDSCSKFMKRPIESFLGEEITGTFLKQPNTELIISSSITFKIIPSLSCGFDFISGLKYDSYDSKMYILLDSDLMVDSYSHNMRYLFDYSKAIIKRNIHIGTVSPDILNKIRETETKQIVERNKRKEKLNESNDYKETAEMKLKAMLNTTFKSKNSKGRRRRDQSTLNTLTERKRNIYSSSPLITKSFIASVKLMEEDNESEVITQLFQVSISERRYSIVNFRYYLLELIPSENLNIVKNASSSNLLIEKKQFSKQNSIMPKIEENDNAKVTNLDIPKNHKSGFSIQINAERKDSSSSSLGKKRLIVEGDNSRLSQINSNSVIDDRPRRSMLVNQSKDSRSNIDLMEPKARLHHKTTTNFINVAEDGGSSSNGNSSQFNTLDLAVQKRFYAYEEALERRAGLYELVGLICIYIIAIMLTFGFTFSSLSNLSERSLRFNVQKDIQNMVNSEASQIMQIYSRILKKIAYEERLFTKDR